jgi:outer membrane receptor protein involved in Fe transport
MRRLARAVLTGVVAGAGLWLGPAMEAAAQERVGTADEAEVAFRLGNQAYLAGDYRLALSHWFASNRLAPNPQVVSNLARCYEKLGELVEAYGYYQLHALSGASGAEQSREAMARLEGQIALLDIQSDPRGATIFLNRRELGGYGETPRILPVTGGTYTVILEARGHVSRTIEGVQAQIGKTSIVTLKLDRVTGSLSLSGRPEGATVTLTDDAGAQVTAQVPTTLTLGAGKYQLVARAPGHVPAERDLEVEQGRTARVDLTLIPQTGSLALAADEPGALVRLDGVVMGLVPLVLDRVSVGEHTLSVESDGFRPARRVVRVEPDARTEVTLELEVAEDVAAASRKVESVEDAPASVSLVLQRELRAFGYQHLAEALSGVRGFYLTDDATYISAGIRGLSNFGDYGNRVLVQLDGHTLNDDWIGSSYVGFDLLTGLTELERLEVVRGPGSTLYGTGALFGVINLVSPPPAAEPEVTVGTAMSGLRTIRAYGAASIPFPEGGVRVYGGGLYVQPGRYESPAYPDALGRPGIAEGMGETMAGTALAKAVWRDLTAQAYFHQRDRQIPTASFGTIFGDRRERTFDRRSFAEVRYEPELTPDTRLATRLQYDHYYYEGDYPYTAQDGGLVSESQESHWLSLEARVLSHPDPTLDLTGGADWRFHMVNQTQASREGETYLDEVHPYHQFSVYAVADWEPLGWFGLFAGVRLDGWWVADLPDAEGNRDDRFWWTINPRLSLRFRPVPEGTLKVLFGRGFRAPSIFELTYNDAGFTQNPNPGLDPETIYTAEVEYSHRLPEGFVLRGCGFLTTIESLVNQTGAGDETDPLVYVNSGEPVWSVGAEVEVQKLLRKGFSLSAWYAFQHTRVARIEGAELPNSPAHLAGVKVIAPILGQDLGVSVRLGIEGGRRDRELNLVDPGLLVDLGIFGDVRAIGMRYALSVRNLLDWDLEYPVGEDLLETRLRQPGISFVADLSFHF